MERPQTEENEHQEFFDLFHIKRTELADELKVLRGCIQIIEENEHQGSLEEKLERQMFLNLFLKERIPDLELRMEELLNEAEVLERMDEEKQRQKYPNPLQDKQEHH